MLRTVAPAAPRRRFSWSDPRTRLVGWQIVAIGTVCAIVALIAMQTASNLRLRGIASGFGYLGRAAGFEIARGPLAYSSRDSYARALALALVNTLRVALLGVLIASLLGLLLGIARLSRVWIVSTLASVYVEIFRNTPLLLQLLFWYALSQALPAPHEALHPLPGVFLSERGLFLPRLAWHGGVVIEHAVLNGFDFRGGISVSPEFAALLIGLSTYTAAFVGEIVRGGVLAVDRGQAEAATALGLSRRLTLRLVVLPQALRMIIPPVTTQFLSLLKNSSLAVAIGYPELISITSTTLNQTGQAIEAITLATVIYLAIGLAVSLTMNLYDSAIAVRRHERRA
jgi:general L-amino acid transport system permease protein